VEDVRASFEGDGGTGGDGLRGRRSAVGGCVAAELRGCDVGETGVGLEVCRLADGGPVRGAGDGGERVLLTV
jgi:hypothetical protein